MKTSNKKKAVKNGSRPLTPPPNEYIPYADDDTSNEELKDAKGKWMQIPKTTIKCPPGLEFLTTLDKLFVGQELKIKLELSTGYQECNKYVVRNELGENVYYTAEDSDCLRVRNYCGPLRPFEMKILNSSAEVMSLNRLIRRQSCWSPCFLQEVEVMAPPGTTIGVIKQECCITRHKFSVRNAQGERMLIILGPCCSWKCCKCCDISFKVLSSDGRKVGRITKEWLNLPKEALANVDDVFGISFPMELDVMLKAVMLGASCFLIDYMFFDAASAFKKDVEKRK